MQTMGYTRNATYLSGPSATAHLPSFLPIIGNHTESYMPHSFYESSKPLSRSMTTLSFRPSVDYGVSKVSGETIPRPMARPGTSLNYLRNIDSMNVPPMFGSARSALNSRFTPDDWNSSNMNNYMSSDKARSASELVRMQTMRLVKNADEKTQNKQTDVNKKLGERIGDINFWASEIDNETDCMISEIETLQKNKQILEKALAETEKPLNISEECLLHREKRREIDLVHDNVEMQLNKEVETIKKCQQEMRGLIRSAADQLSLNKAARHELEKDTRDKQCALNLDNTCHDLRNTSRGINYHDGISEVDNTVSVPESWARFSNNNIQQSQSERASSTEIRNQIQALLNKCATAMVHQWDTVNSAFTDRIREYMDARNKLQTHLSKVLQEIFDMEKNIELIKKSIRDKEGPMQVSQTRLAIRIQRPNVESCKDPARYGLISECAQINETVEQLTNELRAAENALQNLLRNKGTLEQDLSVKNNSLFIGRDRCMGIRKSFPMSPRINTF